MSLTPSTSTFPTQLRGISVDFSEINPGLEEKDLGALTTESLIELLERFLAIDPLELVDADPEIIITGRRGRYGVKNSHHKLTLRPVADPLAEFVELSATEIPAWLDQTDISWQPEAGTAERDLETLLIHQKSSRQYFVAALMIISLGIFGATAYFSFQPAPINNESDYRPIKNPQRIATLKKQAIGHYANVDGSVKIQVKETNRLVLIQTDGPKNSLKEKSAYSFRIMTNAKGEPVLYTQEIGVINLASNLTLRYNGDTYRRIN
jgi:hypothetical protein